MTQTPPSDWKEVLVRFRWPLVIVCLALLALAFYWLTLYQASRAARGVSDLITGAAERAEEAARGFFTGDVTETFLSSIPEIEAGGSGKLEIAKAEITETLTRSDERLVLWDSFSLGTTVTEIQVPVTYRYHLSFDDPWRIKVSGQTCWVYAPPIRPTLPPAIHTDRMQKRTQEDWLRFDGAEQLEELERSLTPRLATRAAGRGHIDLIREPSRRTVAGFVRAWLLREDQWSQDRLHTIQVIFADEDPSDASALGVTLELEPPER